MTSAPAVANDDANRVGPHPGFISSSNQYTSEIRIRQTLKEGGGDPAREDNYCLQGVQLIDNVREYLKLPVRTFDTACTYYHNFRLNFADAEYTYQDAALASLFVACKVEDTIKKSRDILAAAYNIKNPDKPIAADDKVFESKIIIGLERQILETIGFDFRTRYPQKLLVKIVREMLGKTEGHKFFKIAYAMCIDIYKTFIPIKRTTLSMTMAIVELTARMTDNHLDKVQEFASKRPAYHRGAVMETMLDLLDLYVQHYKSTKIGALFDLNKFMDIKIQLNHDLEKAFEPRHLFFCQKCDSDSPQPPTPASANPATDTSVRRTLRGKDGTVRFIYDPEAARSEKDMIATYFKEEFEEHEIEVEEPVPPPSEPRGDDGHGPGHGHGHGRRGGYRGGNRGDRRGPYHRGDRHGRGHGHRGRGRYH